MFNNGTYEAMHADELTQHGIAVQMKLVFYPPLTHFKEI